jgi:uncharacterized protein
MPRANQLSNREACWLAIDAQGLATPRPPEGGRPPSAKRLSRLLDRLGTIQLDAVNVLERTQFVVPFSRIGHYDPAVLRGLTGTRGPWFQYWGHAASLQPVELYPLLRWRMQGWSDDLADGPVFQQRRRAWRAAHADYLGAVLDEVTERGPLTASQLDDPRRRVGEWWDRRSDGRRALELLFGEGVLAGWRNATFERVYDLTERVIPPGILELPTPSVDEAQRELIMLAAGCLGVGSSLDLANYFGLRNPVGKLRVAELVEAGRLWPVEVEGWSQPAYVARDPRPRPPRRPEGTLLSPFDSLIWYRDRTERLFGFHYRIGIYVPAHLRTHGYYVLPLLVQDALVARFDLKADRTSGTLRVAASHLEAGAASASVLDAAVPELRRLGDWLGLEHLAVADRGDLAAALRKAVA